MDEEKFYLFCIVHPPRMEAIVNIEDLTSLIDALKLSVFLPKLLEMLALLTHETHNIDIQMIFRVLDDPEFWRNIRNLANGYDTTSNIRMIKAGLYIYCKRKLSIEIFKKVFLAYMRIDSDFHPNGIKLELKAIFQSFINISRFLPRRLIEMWINFNKKSFRNENLLCANEYFFLAASTLDRDTLINEKLSNRFAWCLEKDPKTGTYALESLITSPDPDQRLERVLGFNINSTNVFFIDSDKRPELFNKNVQNKEGIEGLAALLKDQELTKSVRETLNLANSLRSSNYLIGELFGDYDDSINRRPSVRKHKQSSFSFIPFSSSLNSKRPQSANSLSHLMPSENEQRNFLKSLTRKEINSYIPSFMLFPEKSQQIIRPFSAENGITRKYSLRTPRGKIRSSSGISSKQADNSIAIMPQSRPVTAPISNQLSRPNTAHIQFSPRSPKIRRPSSAVSQPKTPMSKTSILQYALTHVKSPTVILKDEPFDVNPLIDSLCEQPVKSNSTIIKTKKAHKKKIWKY
ncbi:unnamed protein product [Blepharisma stoltei]|uniref:ELYS-like domain-containing protein n=1 Tax=Blepharisma stoltei TaxID=1481888 RepID=A0AAU9KFM8_9CILI|nr:unnamed protein product [Blepharisma stoltei]